MNSAGNLLLGFLVACALFAAEPVDRYGGWTSHDLGATGRFRIAQWKDRSWIVTPEGHPLIVVGLSHSQMPPSHLRPPGDTVEAKFGGDSKLYADDVVSWMRSAGFNTFSYGTPAAPRRR